MQLTGPPRINGWTAPMPIKQSPMEGLWRQDSDLTVINKYRNGDTQRVGEAHWRGEWTVVWDSLSYETAMRILYEVGAQPATASGTFLWTPRTRQPGDPQAIDLDGDGVADIVLEEIEIKCRLAGPQPSTTPIYRMKGGEKIARLELQIESARTYPERAGFGFPESLNFGVQADSGDELDLSFLDAQGADSTKIAQVVIADSNGETVDVLDYPGGLPYTFPSTQDYSVSVVSGSNFQGIADATLKGVIDLSTVELIDLVDAETIVVAGNASGSLFGTTQTGFLPDAARFIRIQDGGDVRLDTIPDEAIEYTEKDTSSTDDISLIPSSQIEVVDIRRTGHTGTWGASAIAPTLRSATIERTSVTVDLDAFAAEVPTVLERLNAIASQAQGDQKNLMVETRAQLTYLSLISTEAGGADLRGETTGGDPILPPQATYVAPHGDTTHGFTDWYETEGSATPLNRVFFQKAVSGHATLQNIPAMLDSIRTAVDAGVDWSGAEIVFEARERQGRQLPCDYATYEALRDNGTGREIVFIFSKMTAWLEILSINTTANTVDLSDPNDSINGVTLTDEGTGGPRISLLNTTSHDGEHGVVSVTKDAGTGDITRVEVDTDLTDSSLGTNPTGWVY